MTDAQPGSNVNSTLRDFLRDYVQKRQQPKFAVLVNGPWGSGKTHFIKQLVADGDLGKSFYVSLFGLSSREQMEQAVLASIYPILMSRPMTAITKFTMGLLKTTRFDPDIQASDLLDIPEDAVFIFDDLERCTVAEKDVLGFVNSFLEDRRSRVIVIANESEIASTYKKMREKIFGQSITHYPDFRSTYPGITSDLPDGWSRDFIIKSIDISETVFLYSGKSNIRLIEQDLWSLQRLLTEIDDDLTENEDAMSAIMRIFLIAFVEYRSDNISDSSIRLREQIPYLGLDKERNDDLRAVVERHHSANFEDSVIGGDALADAIVHAKIDRDAINKSIRLSSYAASDADQPAWVVVWNLYRNDSVKVRSAIREIREQISTAEIKDIGEILHITGLLIHLSSRRLIKKSLNGIVAEMKAYIRKLEQKGAIPPFDRNSILSPIRHGASGGYGFYESNTAHFGEVYQYIEMVRARVLVGSYNNKANDLLELIDKNISLFCSSLWIDRDGENDLVRLPVLTAINPKRFVEKLLGTDADSQFQISAALSYRFDANNIVNGLQKEIPWAREVASIIAQKAKKMKALDRDRVIRNWGLVEKKLTSYEES